MNRDILKSNRQNRINQIILDNVKKQLREQVSYLKTLPNPAQRSEEWFKMRKNKITASMIAPLLGVGRYGSRREVIGEKSGCLQRDFQGNFFTNWGTDFEDEATKLYQKLFNIKVFEFSLIEHPKYPFLGASPDGITNDGTMLEIKCPPRRAITGIVPDYYNCQIQLQLEVCNLEVCDFLECLFTKYSSRKEFLDDNDFYVEINGLLLGSSETEFKRVHSDEFIDKKTGYTIFKGSRQKSQYEIGLDINQGVDPEDIHNIVYWKLERISCVRVSRDREWFEKALPEFQKAWGEIEKFRKNPEEFEKMYPGRRIKNRAIFDLETGSSSTQEEINENELNDLANCL